MYKLNKSYTYIYTFLTATLLAFLFLFFNARPAESSYLPTTGSNIGIGTFTPVGAFTVLSGNVGIGTFSPTSILQVVGAVTATSFAGDGSALTGIATGWSDGGTNVYTSTTTDNVGIGTTTPTAALLVQNAGTQDSFRVNDALLDSSPFIIDAAGNVGIGTTTPVGALTVMNGNVGIGTWSLTGNSGALIVASGAGNVGIGTIRPGAALDVNGVVRSISGGFTFPDGTTQTSAASGGGWTDGGTNVYTSTTTDNVGIGTTTPVAFLTIDSTAAQDFLRVNDNGPGDISPALLIDQNGRVGIGTTSINDEFEVHSKIANTDVTFYSNDVTNLVLWSDRDANADADSYLTFNTQSSSRFSMGYDASAGGFDITASSALLDSARFFISTAGNVGISTILPVNGTSIMNGNVGIGTWSPREQLEMVDGRLLMGNSSAPGTTTNKMYAVGGNLFWNGTQLDTGAVASGWTDGGTNVYTSATTDNVGIGTTTPTSTLEIVKTAAGTAPLMVSTTGPSDGDYFIVSSSGSVGIGTRVPGATLEISGAEPQLRITPSAGQSSFMYINALDDTKEGGITLLAAGVFKWNIFKDNTNPNVGDAGDLKITGVLDSDGSPRIHLPAGSTNVYLAESGGNVGIGTSGPVFKFEVSSNANAAIVSSRYIASANGTDIMGRRARGTSAAPTALLSGDQIIGFSGQGYGTSAFHNSTGQIDMMAAENFTDSANGTYMGFLTTSLGSIILAERMRIDPAGNVGVGTTTPVGALTVMNGNVGIGTWSPTSRLQVIGNVDATTFSGDGSALTGINSGGWSDGGTNVYTSATTDNVGIGTTTPTAALLVQNAGTQASFRVNDAVLDGSPFIVDAVGNVGIGTVTPFYKLTVVGNGISDLVWLQDIASGQNPAMSFVNDTFSTIAQIGIGNSGSSAPWRDNLFINTFNASDIVFATNDTGSFTGTERMRIRSGGNVGIGTTTPFSKLVVNGGVAIGTLTSSSFINTAAPSGGLIVEKNVGVGTTTPVGALTVMNGNVGIGTWSPTSRLQVIGNVDATTFSGDGSALTGINSGGWSDGGTNVYTSATTDNVGIGTTTPTAALLVQNAGTQDSFRVNDAVLDGSPFIVDAVGNVGIGTFAPQFSLQVGSDPTVQDGAVKALVASAGSTNLVVRDSLNAVELELWAGILGDNTLGASIGAPTNHNFQIITNDTERLRIMNTGNVGIGTSIPLSKLVINGGVGIGTTALSTFTNTAAPSGGLIVEKNVGVGTTTPVGALTVMNGNVGIGTWSPREQLEMVDGRLLMGNSSAPGTTTNKMYAVGGNLFWNGTQLDTGAVASGWSDGGTNVYTSTTTDNVGIGTTTPNAATLEIVKNAAQAALKVSSSSTGSGDFLVVNSQGNVGIGTNDPAVALLNVNGETYIAGPVGMGTFTPAGMLDVRQDEVRIWTGGGTNTNATSAGELYVEGDLEVDGTMYGDGSGLTGVGSLVGAGGWVDAGANVFQSTTTDLVGIGTTSPSTTLEVVQQGTNPALMISSVFNGDGNLMIVHSGGNVGIGTVQPIAKIVVENTGSIDSLRVNDVTNDSSPFVIDQNGNVGVGTTTSIYNLSVVGNVVDDLLSLRNNNTSGASAIAFYDNTNTAKAFSGYANATTSNPAVAATYFTGTRSGVDIFFYTDGDGSGNIAPRMRIKDGSGFVGIGTTTPFSKLVVNGGVAIGTLTSSTFINTTAPFGGLIVEKNVGIGTTLSNNNILSVNGGAYIAGNVGIGTLYPSTGGILDVRQDEARIWTGGGTDTNATSAGELYVEGDLEVDGTVYGDGSGLTGVGSLVGAGGWVDAGANVFQSTTTDLVGIGTTSPSTTLEVVQQGTNPSLMISSVFNGDGNLMIVHSGGNVGIGTVQPIAKTVIQNTGAIDSFRVNDITADSSPFVIDQDGNVGIGTSSSSLKLSVISTSGDTMSVQNTSASGWSNVIFRNTAGTQVGGVGYGNASASVETDMVYLDSASKDIGFFTGLGFNERMRISASSGNIGIGTITPFSKLVVNGGVGIGTMASSTFINTVAPSGGLIVENNVGIGTTTPVGALTVMNGNVGVGTWSPTARLQVIGNIVASGSVTYTGSVIDGWTDDGATVYTTATTDLVGIGTTSPSTTLEIVQQSTNPALMISSVFNGDGNLMIVHSGGNVGIGTVQPIAKIVVENTGAIDSFRVNDITADSSPFIIDQNGNVGIATTSAGSARVEIRAATAENGLLIRAGENDNVDYIMHLEDQDSSVMAVHVDTSGFVGLGTTRPGSRLTVAGSASFGSGLAYTAIAAPTDGLVVQGNVGIGTFVPGGSLEIITAASTIPFMVSSTATADGDRLIVNSAGNVGIGTTSATVALLNVNGETYIAGPVGMGTFTPTGMLDVRQAEVRIWTGGGTDTNATSAGELYVQGDLEVDGTVYGDGSGLTSVGSLVGAGGWVDAGVNVFQATTTDLVGIGTTSPSTTLEIVQQSTNPALMISSVFNGDGNLMIVHSGGNVGIGTVQPIAKIVVENTGAIDSLRVNDITNDSSPFVIDQNGNVGIGTTSTAGLMTVIGNVGIGTTTPYRMITPPANGLVVEGATGIGTWAVPSGKLAVMGNVGIGTVGTAGALTVVSGNVGFGTWSPNSRLSVVGNIGVGTTTPYLTFSAPLNGMMVEGNVGIGTWNASSGKMIIMGGNVGIGTITPVGALTVMNGNVGIGTWSPTGKMVVLGGNVGIGTTALMATLDVAATGSLRIPYGYSPTVTEQGSVGIGTVNHQFYFNTAGTKRVVASSHTRCLMVENLASGDDNFPMGSFTDSVAIDGVWCTCSGTCTTKATFTLEDGSANAMTISGTNPTCQNIGTTPTSAAVSGANATLTAKESMRFDVTNTPSPNGSDDYEICVSYTITAVP